MGEWTHQLGGIGIHKPQIQAMGLDVVVRSVSSTSPVRQGTRLDQTDVCTGYSGGILVDRLQAPGNGCCDMSSLKSGSGIWV
jgi:hypothetical protein